MIKSFGDRQTEKLFHDEFIREFQGVAARAKRRLKDFHAIRINDQYRIIFRWVGSDAHDVSVIDYH